MTGKIALEEHFAIPETLNDSRGYLPDDTWPILRDRIVDFHGQRLQQMDEHGIEMMLLSLNAPAIQAIPDTARADEIARKANDHLAEQVAKRPDRFAGFAALPMQDPDLAAKELARCVKQLGFKGALVNGYSQVNDAETLAYYDAPQYLPFWQVVDELAVPFYLHPRNPAPINAKIYDGHNWLMGPTWAFGQETAVHALRLMGSGLFDRHPRLKIILGHLGENLPFGIWRVDHCNSWVTGRHKYQAEKKIADYFYANFYVTTSGNFRTQSLIGAMMELGADRVLFSVDWPFESIASAAQWFDSAAISEADRLKIGRTNAQALFKLDGAASRGSGSTAAARSAAAS